MKIVNNKTKHPLNVDASSKAYTYTIWKSKKMNGFLFHLEFENDYLYFNFKCLSHQEVYYDISIINMNTNYWQQNSYYISHRVV